MNLINDYMKSLKNILFIAKRIKLPFYLLNKKFPLLNINIRRFCHLKEDMVKETTPEPPLSHKLKKDNSKINKLTLKILTFLENNQETYKGWCEDSIKLSYDLSEPENVNNETLKNELIRINKQINNFSKENYYFEEFKNLLEEYSSTESLISEAKEIGEKEIVDSASKELLSLKEKLTTLEQEIIEFLIPDETAKVDSITLEIKSAAGGTEGALFAEDLLNVYRRLCDKMGWRMSDIQYSSLEFAGKKGCKNGLFKITGPEVYKYFRFESGVHKVQRVPVTEKNGRIHSSTCQVVIIPESNFSFSDINERDLKIDTMRSSGPGGQSVNKTESAIRITHIPSGIVVQNQDERDQHKNKARAMEVLRQRLFSQQMQTHKSEHNEKRRSQLGSGNLHEKIRTYNFPDSRVTDHRLGTTLYNIDNMLEGDMLEEFLEKSLENEKGEKLQALLKRLDDFS
jgi:peptide chain release factor 1